MGRKEQSPWEKELRRGDIIDAAERIFFSRGYEDSSMDEVAKGAEFSKRTVYLYFISRQKMPKCNTFLSETADCAASPTK